MDRGTKRVKRKHKIVRQINNAPVPAYQYQILKIKIHRVKTEREKEEGAYNKNQSHFSRLQDESLQDETNKRRRMIIGGEA